MFDRISDRITDSKAFEVIWFGILIVFALAVLLGCIYGIGALLGVVFWKTLVILVMGFVMLIAALFLLNWMLSSS